MKIFKNISIRNSNGEFIPLEIEIKKIYQGRIKLMLHRSIEADKTKWIVAEYYTGMKVSEGKTITDAKERTKLTLEYRKVYSQDDINKYTKPYKIINKD
jgi:hypothetical protein